MSDTSGNNPFTFWQQFWQNATPQAAAFLPPLTLEETEKKINELKSVEIWLNFNLQAIHTQIALLEQQKRFFESTQTEMPNAKQKKEENTP